MKESKFTLEVRKQLESIGEIYAKKIVAAFGMSMAGVPDIIGCYKGRFFAIECKCVSLPKRKDTKVMNDLFTTDQIINLSQIEDAKGIALTLIYFDELRVCLFWDWKISATTLECLMMRLKIAEFKLRDINKIFVDYMNKRGV
jgi:penicillin-binding protein-related factor A (putative recombinase)